MKKIYIAAALLTAAFALSGCSKNTETNTGTETGTSLSEESGDVPADAEEELSEEALDFINGFDIEYNSGLADALNALSDADMTVSSYSGSLTEAYLNRLMTEDSFRVVMCSENEKIEIASAEENDAKIAMYSGSYMAAVFVYGTTLFYYAPGTEGSYMVTIGDEELAEYGREEMVTGSLGEPYASGEIGTARLSCGGKEYTAEEYCGMIYLYGKDGNIAMSRDNESCFTIRAEFGVSEDLFIPPDGAQFINYDTLLEQAEDESENHTAAQE